MRGLALLTAACAVAFAGAADAAKIELSTLPPREGVEITVYKDVNLALVREHRAIRFHEGRNDIAFSWADTQIDPTSVRITVAGEGIELAEVSYPPEQPNTLVWEINADADGECEIEVRYFTSGIRWGAAYQLILAPDESTAEFSGLFLVTNHSGETYEAAQVALLTGGVRMVEDVEYLAEEGLQAGFDRFGWQVRTNPPLEAAGAVRERGERGGYFGRGFGGGGYGAYAGGALAPPSGASLQSVQGVVEREAAALYVAGAQAISEHHRYDISALQDLNAGWTTRLRFASAPEVAVALTCRWRSDSGAVPQYVYKLKNNEDNGLGESPLPAGPILIFKRDTEGRLQFLARSGLDYCGVGQEAEITGAPALDVVIEHEMTRLAKGGHVISQDGVIEGHQELFEYSLVARNRRELPATLEMSFIVSDGQYELYDIDEAEREQNLVKWTVPLDPDAEWQQAFGVHYFHGKREPLTIPAPEFVGQILP